jgi:predicted nucleic acid-binding protein
LTPAVVDASVAAKWFIGDAPLRREALMVRRAHRTVAPNLLLTELANALWRYVRTGVVDLEEAIEAVAAVAADATLTADPLLLVAAQRLSADRDHAVYDCLYVALAIREGLPLITADEKLVRKLSDLPRLSLIGLSTFAEGRL